MGVNVTGQDKVMRQIREKMSGPKFERARDRALTEAGKAFVTEMKKQFQPWKDTGASIREMTLSKPHTQGGVRMVTVYWQGPNKRYALIHLNEFGTVKNPNPRGKGSIARALRNSEKTYQQILKRELERGM